MADLRERHFRSVDTGDVAGSSLVLTVPTGSEWFLHYWIAILTATATVGSRLPIIGYRDASATTLFTKIAPVTTASTVTTFSMGPGMIDDASAALGSARQLMPKILLTPGQAITFTDFNAIDALDTIRIIASVEQERV